MFAKLTGRIDTISGSHLILDVNGVGYLVSISSRTRGMIGVVGDLTGLFIETVVREDQIALYGFADAVEKDWFNLLCTVQGVGAKAALAILAVTPPEHLPMVIAAEDKAAISRADGIGPKLATRIVTELKEKAGKMLSGQTAGQAAKTAISGGVVTKTAQISPVLAANGDAISALVNLGYGRVEAFEAVTKAGHILGDVAEDVQKLIRESLKELSA